MACRRKSPQLALKLDVILGKDMRDMVDYTPRLTERLRSERDESQTATTYSVTLQKSNRPSSNDPEFLHIGRWPSMDMIELSGRSAPPTDDEMTGLSNRLKYDVSHGDTEKTSSAKPVINSWHSITAEQLSMAVDLDERTYPLTTISTHVADNSTLITKGTYASVTVAQQALFHQEIMDEYLIRTQTVEHLEELEDNDNAIEIVATLEGYRQTGWAEEMIKAFPRECWVFWSNSGLGLSTRSSDHLCKAFGTSTCGMISVDR